MLEPRRHDLCAQILGEVVEQVFEFAESPDGKRAGRFQEHLEDARPVAPDKRISAPCAFMRSFLYPVQFAVRARSGVGAGLLKLPHGTTKMPGARLAERQNDGGRDFGVIIS